VGRQGGSFYNTVTFQNCEAARFFSLRDLITRFILVP
jgi:hypothetical protein